MNKRKFARALISRAILDLLTEHEDSAEVYILSPDFPEHCEVAGWPENLVDVLEEIMQHSDPQKTKYCRETINVLNAWE